jgi:phospholipid transport system transporter-binding protein
VSTIQVPSLSGPLTRLQAVSVMAQAQDWLAQSAQKAPLEPLVVDLSSLTKVDTTALSVLLGLKRMAARLNCQLTYAGAPESLLALARLSSVDQLLKLA